MDMPSRIEIRRWLVENSRAEILDMLAVIKQQHGAENEQDVRDFLNIERTNKTVDSAAECSLLTEHEKRKAAIAADIEFQKRLHTQETI